MPPDLTFRAKPPRGIEKIWGGRVVTHAWDRTLPRAHSSPDGEKDPLNVGKNQRQAPSILGFRPRLAVAERTICDFLAISTPEPLKSSKPLSWLGLRCAIIASAAKGAAARPTGSHLSGAFGPEGIRSRRCSTARPAHV